MNKEDLGKLILRIGLAVVLIWFGIDKFVRPEIWIAWVPEWFVNLIPLSMDLTLLILGIFEIVIGLIILIGFFTEIASVITAIFLLVTILSSINGEILVRDIGLLFLAMALVIIGAGAYSLDSKIRGK